MNPARQRLEAMRHELRSELEADVAVLARDVEDKGEDTTPSQHPADVASDLYAREELVAEEVNLRRELRDVDDALARIDQGAYGRCIDCGDAIAAERLEVLPAAARCITCQRAADRSGRSLVRA